MDEDNHDLQRGYTFYHNANISVVVGRVISRVPDNIVS